MIYLALADDQKLFRQALGELFKQEQGFCLHILAESGPELLRLLKNAQRLPDVVLININMPEMDGIELNHLLQTHFPSIKVLALSVNSPPKLLSRMMEEGLGASLIKNCDKDELFNAINTVYKGEFYNNHDILEAVPCSAIFKEMHNKEAGGAILSLTKREKEILEMICTELSTAEIAEKLYLSERTVEGHRKNLLSKTNTRNTTGLVLFAIKSGLFNLGL